MANNKKFYWIKLKTDFFNQKEIKKLRKIAGGDTYTIIYLKLQLLSAKKEGIIKYDGTEKDLIEQLELELDEDKDNISVTLAFLQANNLMEQISDTDYLLGKVCDSIGKEGSSAERVRRHREKQKMLQCNTKETNSNTEIEKEIESDTEIKEEKKPKKRKKSFFTLSKLTSFDNLTEEYVTKLKEKIEAHNEDLMLRRLKANSPLSDLYSYQDFENRFLSNGMEKKDWWRTFLQYEKYVFEAESKRKGLLK